MKQGVRLGQQLVTAVLHEEHDLSDQLLDEIRGGDQDLTNGALLGLCYVIVGAVTGYAKEKGRRPADVLTAGFANIDHLFEE